MSVRCVDTHRDFSSVEYRVFGPTVLRSLVVGGGLNEGSGRYLETAVSVEEKNEIQ